MGEWVLGSSCLGGGRPGCEVVGDDSGRQPSRDGESRVIPPSLVLGEALVVSFEPCARPLASPACVPGRPR